MSLLVVGTVGIDTIETPTSRRENVLGGSAAYFAYAASFYTKVHLLSVVGQDFPSVHRTLLESRDVDLTGLQVALGETFKWTGRYHEDMINRDTLKVELNVFGTFEPKVPDAARTLPFVFLANGAPAIQRKVLHQMTKRPKFVAADTMDLWIETTRPELEKLLKEVDAIILNDSEARLLTDRRELLRAGLDILEFGPKYVIIKKGEHGAMVVSREGHFALPGFPLEDVFDPTGAGDTFAGGIMGYLAECGEVTPGNLRRAIAHGAVVASYTVQDFSLEALKRIGRRDLDHRYQMLLDLVRVTHTDQSARPKRTAPPAKFKRRTLKAVTRDRKPAKTGKRK